MKKLFISGCILAGLIVPATVSAGCGHCEALFDRHDAHLKRVAESKRAAELKKAQDQYQMDQWENEEQHQEILENQDKMLREIRRSRMNDMDRLRDDDASIRI
jgi:hypothetical protein